MNWARGPVRATSEGRRGRYTVPVEVPETGSLVLPHGGNMVVGADTQQVTAKDTCDTPTRRQEAQALPHPMKKVGNTHLRAVE